MTINYEIGKQRTDGRMRITLLLCIGTSKKRIRTDLSVAPSDLNRKGKIRTDAPIYNKVREKIAVIEREYNSLDTFLTGEKLTAREAIERMRHTDIPSFHEYADRWVARSDIKGLKNYRTALKNFKAFTGGDIAFSSFTHSLLDDYLYSLRDKPRAQSLYVNAIKKIYSDAEKDYDIKPFGSFRVDIPRQRKSLNKALDIETLRKIFSWQGTSRRAILARDCALLSFCLCGTNSADLFTAPPIKKNTLSYDRQKTKDRRMDNAHMEIAIPKQIKDLVKKYGGKGHAFLFHTLYPDYQAFNKNLNIGLKKIQKDLGLENLTFYAFRHSWATIARNDLGIDRWTVHESLCHSGDDTAIDDIYIRKDFGNVNKANQKVVGYLFKGLSLDA